MFESRRGHQFSVDFHRVIDGLPNRLQCASLLDTVRHTSMPRHSRNVKNHKKQIRRGLALYQTAASPYWYARIWLPAERRHLVRSTKERSRLAAGEAAEEIVSELKAGKRLDRVPRDRAFESFAEKMIENDERASGQSLHRLTARNERSILHREPDGVLAYLGRIDVRSVRTCGSGARGQASGNGSSDGPLI